MKNRFQPYLYWIFLAFMAVGYFYPAIGLAALICMLAPVVIAPFRGRYWCGNYCPRGSFYDHVLAKFSPQKPIPAFFKSNALRIIMVITIMTVFIVQTYEAWGNLPAMGMVLLRLIFITTVIGVVLGWFYHSRTWCSFCPMGSLAAWFSRPRSMPLKVESTCVSCTLCSKACPFQLAPYQAKDAAAGFTAGDCLKCGHCEAACPKDALSFDAATGIDKGLNKPA
jgi:polyferredoxin